MKALIVCCQKETTKAKVISHNRFGMDSEPDESG